MNRKKITDEIVAMFKSLVDPNVELKSNILEQEVLYGLQHDLQRKIQQLYPDLRYRHCGELRTLGDYINKAIDEDNFKREFFEKALGIISETSGHPEYTLDSKLYAEHLHHGNVKESQEGNYYVHCLPVYKALTKRMYTKVEYYPNPSLLENAHTLRELIDIYYRKGRF